MIRADRRELEPVEPRRRVARAHPAERLAVGVEGHQRDERQLRDAAHRLDRGDELVEVVERLEQDQVDAAALEDPRLLGHERPRLARVELLELAQAGRSRRR